MINSCVLISAAVKPPTATAKPAKYAYELTGNLINARFTEGTDAVYSNKRILFANDIYLAIDCSTYETATSINGSSWSSSDFSESTSLYNLIVNNARILDTSGNSVRVADCFGAKWDDTTFTKYASPYNIRKLMNGFSLCVSVIDNTFVAYIPPINYSTYTSYQAAKSKYKFPVFKSIDGQSWSVEWCTYSHTPQLSGFDYYGNADVEFYKIKDTYVRISGTLHLQSGTSTWYGYPTIMTSANGRDFTFVPSQVENMKSAALALINNDTSVAYVSNITQPFMSANWRTKKIIYNSSMDKFFLLDGNYRGSASLSQYPIYQSSGVLYYSSDLVNWSAIPLPNLNSTAASGMMNMNDKLMIYTTPSNGSKWTTFNFDTNGQPVFNQITISTTSNNYTISNITYIESSSSFVLYASPWGTIDASNANNSQYFMTGQYTAGSTSITLIARTISQQTSTTLPNTNIPVTYLFDCRKDSTTNAQFFAIGGDSIYLRLDVNLGTGIPTLAYIYKELSLWDEKTSTGWTYVNSYDKIGSTNYAIARNNANAHAVITWDNGSYNSFNFTKTNNRLTSSKLGGLYYTSNNKWVLLHDTGTFYYSDNINGPWTGNNYSNAYYTVFSNASGSYVNHKQHSSGRYITLFSNAYWWSLGSSSNTSYIIVTEPNLTTLVDKITLGPSTSTNPALCMTIFRNSQTGNEFILMGGVGGYYTYNISALGSGQSYLGSLYKPPGMESTDVMLSVLVVPSNESGIYKDIYVAWCYSPTTQTYYFLLGHNEAFGDYAKKYQFVDPRKEESNNVIGAINTSAWSKNNIFWDNTTKTLLFMGSAGVYTFVPQFDANGLFTPFGEARLDVNSRQIYPYALTKIDSKYYYKTDYGNVEITINV